MRYLSLFSGMEAAYLAWAPLGWECVAVAEIEPAACALLRHRLPDVPNLGSVTDITDEQIAALGPIDVLIGGSPCQDLSVAGRRAGLEGARSCLFHEQLRIFNAARLLCGARWLVWENVPGAFSSNKGRDFAVVVGAMAGSVVPVPATAWDAKALRWVTTVSSNGPCLTRSRSEWRSGAVECSLSSILETGPIAPRYFLSPTACAGILRRADGRGKGLLQPLRQALEAVTGQAFAPKSMAGQASSSKSPARSRQTLKRPAAPRNRTRTPVS